MLRAGRVFTPIVFIVAGCSLAFAWTALAERIADRNLRFTINIPEGFTRDTDLVRADPDFVYAFRGPASTPFGAVIIIERVRGTISRERLDLSQAPAGFSGRILVTRWNGLDIKVIELPEEAGGQQLVNYNVPVPLKPEAIQIRVIGDRDDAPHLWALTNQLLDSLEGESSWTEESAAAVVAPPQAAAGSPPYSVLVLTLIGLGIVTGLVLLGALRYRSRRGVVLLLSVLIYASGVTLRSGTSLLELRATASGIVVLGLLGMLMGLFDLIWHPPAPPPVDAEPAEDW